MSETSAAGVLPEGTVTFLFTDLEGSTRLLEAHPTAYREAVRRHHALLRGAVEAHGGVVFETVGDAVYAAFARPADAVAATLAGQQALLTADWDGLGAGAISARMALHTGEVERQGDHYFGAPPDRAGRLLPAAHGGQVVLSAATAELVQDALPAGAALRDLGAHRLKDLQRPERVFQLADPALPGAFPALRTLDARPHNLPLQLTSFVGREREVGEVAALLGAHRLVTLTGPGGTGKTRLALQAAAEVLEAYLDGVWLVELAALTDPVLVLQAVALAVGAREEPGRPLLATLTDALRPKRLLLLLDNCEHQLDAGARLAEALLRACSHVTILCTSREALGIAGETVWRVPSLAVPAAAAAGTAPVASALAGYAAVRLFCERAAAVQPGFTLTPENAAAVAQICARLDGIPLALELAAARVRVLPPPQLLTRLADRFRLLTGGSRTALERHQTLRATVDWSHDLLTEPERRLFARLAVFAGGWTLEAAEAVGAGDGVPADEVLELLTRLVDKSLVVAEAQPDGTARYRLLETLRQYAQERLAASGEAAAILEQHAATYLALAETAAPALHGPEQAAWLDRLATEHDNLRGALRWALERGDAERAVRLAWALRWFWEIRGHVAAGRAWLDEALALAGLADRPALRARALAAAGRLASWARDEGAARRQLEASVALFRALGNAAAEAAARRDLGTAAFRGGDAAAGRAALEASLALCRALGDPWLTAETLNLLATITRDEGQEPAALPLFEESLALYRQVGDRRGEASVLLALANLALGLGDYERAQTRSTQSLAIMRALGHVTGIAVSLQTLALIALLQDTPDAARAPARDVAALGQEGAHPGAVRWGLLLQGFVALAEQDPGSARGRFAEDLVLAGLEPQSGHIALATLGLAAVAAAQDQAKRAVCLAAAAGTVGGGSRHFDMRPRLLATLADRWLEPARRSLTADALAAAQADGQAMSLEQAVAYALDSA